MCQNYKQQNNIFISNFIFSDPNLGEYIPQAPVNDEAKKHNEKLSGMGGVFNTVNLHVYHYAGNNPVKYVDPDGRENKVALEWMKDKLTGVLPGYWYFTPTGQKQRDFKKAEIPEQILCYQAVFCAYANSGVTKLPMTRWAGMQFFKKNTTTMVGGKSTIASFVIDITAGQMGDIVFLGKDANLKGHAVLLVSIDSVTSTKIEITTYGAFSPDGNIGPEKTTFTKTEANQWISSHNDYLFRGYGQLKMEVN